MAVAVSGMLVPKQTQFLPPVTAVEFSIALVTVLAPIALAVPAVKPEAVPVQFVNTPLEGVPSTPPLTNTDPAVPTATPNAVVTLAPVRIVEGAIPAPPPMTKEFAANAAEVAHAVPLEK
jgi:hypothetical protein